MLPRLVAVLHAAVVAGATLLVLLARAALEGRPATIADLVTAVAVAVIVSVLSWMLASAVAWRSLRVVASRQSAPDETASLPPRFDRFDRFDESARRVLTLAQDEAQRFNHNYIGTEDLLLALVREREGVAGRVLESMNVELAKVRTAVEFLIGRGDAPVVGEVGLTPRSKRVIELAIDEARRLGDHDIGAEHLLLGLVREGEGIGAGVLESMRVRPDLVREEVLRLRGEAR